MRVLKSADRAPVTVVLSCTEAGEQPGERSCSVHFHGLSCGGGRGGLHDSVEHVEDWDS